MSVVSPCSHACSSQMETIFWVMRQVSIHSRNSDCCSWPTKRSKHHRSHPSWLLEKSWIWPAGFPKVWGMAFLRVEFLLDPCDLAMTSPGWVVAGVVVKMLHLSLRSSMEVVRLWHSFGIACEKNRSNNMDSWFLIYLSFMLDVATSYKYTVLAKCHKTTHCRRYNIANCPPATRLQHAPGCDQVPPKHLGCKCLTRWNLGQKRKPGLMGSNILVDEWK